MSKIATTTLNLSEYRMVDGFYLRNGFSLVQEKYCTETGEPIFVNKRANGKWGYCDNEGTDFYVEWKIPDDMIVVPRYIFENEKGEKVKWCLCIMKL